MRSVIVKFVLSGLLIVSVANAQTNPGHWKKAVVKIESIMKRYSQQEVDVLLQKKLDSIGHGISQHETYDIMDGFDATKDTIRGTGVFIADGQRIYLVTAKHNIKATGINAVSDLLTIWMDASEKKTNDIYLLNLKSTQANAAPFIFSDKEDLAIISFQRNSHKAIVAYMKRNGLLPIPIQDIAAVNEAVKDVFTVGFPTNNKSATSSEGRINTVNSEGFNANIPVYAGNGGGPVVQNNKLVGIISYPEGMTKNVELARHPHQLAGSATVIKATAIIPLLRQLQSNERTPAFNQQ